MSLKFVPFYFPQFHTIPENDEWWGKGYTDWDRVKNAVPHSNNHHQPRVPFDFNYYDQSLEATVQKQIDTALEYNIHGFNFYHYWFNGKLLLEKPMNVFTSLKHDLKFCITWANETWTRRWEGKFNDILIRQTHTQDENEWNAHFEYLNVFFSDERYIRIDDKPVFCIYRPDIIENIDILLSFFNNKAISYGYKGIYFIGVHAYEVNSSKVYQNFNAILRFQPRNIFNSNFKTSNPVFLKLEQVLRQLPESLQIIIGEAIHKFQGKKIYSYDKFWEYLLSNMQKDLESDKTILQSIIVDWDNTARYGRKAKYFEGVSPAKFKKYLSKVIDLLQNTPDTEKIIFINAWNEWSEGAYLEPDQKNGYEYLNIIKEACDTWCK